MSPDRVVFAVAVGAVAGSAGRTTFVPAAARRLAKAIVALVDIEGDVRTLAAWGRAVGVSRGTLRGWCHVALVRPADALAFARALRAIWLAGQLGVEPRDLLEFSDSRSLHRFLTRTGLGPAVAAHISAVAYCECQPCVRAPHVAAEVLLLLGQTHSV